jgi:hypothetical protein
LGDDDYYQDYEGDSDTNGIDDGEAPLDDDNEGDFDDDNDNEPLLTSAPSDSSSSDGTSGAVRVPVVGAGAVAAAGGVAAGTSFTTGRGRNIVLKGVPLPTTSSSSVATTTTSSMSVGSSIDPTTIKLFANEKKESEKKEIISVPLVYPNMDIPEELKGKSQVYELFR